MTEQTSATQAEIAAPQKIRFAFIALARAEVTRAITNISRSKNGVSSYKLARQADDSVEAFGNGLRVTGDLFWTIEADDIEGMSVNDYFDVYGEEMRREYELAGIEI